MVVSDLYARAVTKFGKEHQLIVTFGELSECTAEIAKHMIPGREHDEQDLVDEIADVCIMMKQMEVIYGERLVKAVYKKLNKLNAHVIQGVLDV